MNLFDIRRVLKRYLTFGFDRAPLIPPFAKRSVFDVPEMGHWYHPVMLGPSTVGHLAIGSADLRQVIAILEHLESDDYVRYLLAYYRTGLERYGDAWRYADILTVLLAAAQLIQPQSYLEIGVRRGRSMSVVAATCPACKIVGIDMWVPNYAGVPNPGPDFVRTEMAKLGHTGQLDLISGNSHNLLPHYFRQHPDTFFDLITVDGDHSKQGAIQDLKDVLPRLTIGGVLVFDDISHPAHPYLRDVWNTTVCSDSRFVTWEFSELGYGVAIAIRKEA